MSGNNDDFVSGFVDEVKEISLKNGGSMFNITINGDSYGFGKYAPKFGEGSEIGFYISWNGDYANVDRDSVEVYQLVEPANNSGGRSGNGRSGGGGRSGGNSRPAGGGGSRSGGQGGQGRGGQGQGRGQDAGRSGGQGQGRSQGQGGSPQRSTASSGRSGGASSGGQSSAGKDDYWTKKEERDVVVQRCIQYQSSRNAAISLVSAALANGAVSLPAAKAKQWDALVALVDEVTEQFEANVDAVREPQKTTGRGSGRKQQEQEDDLPEDDLPEED